ncbi:helix-turn-helix domain-containing protein [Noviherbaspirillum soli]|uniref:helix-turn-helix domain-containing protein n=1 Tax=Noviherbaspirillum soli TaxID=1064518 RepID=UPI00188CE54F|nr:helix-turn-helix transcriptional regulator [Noviherbaspirillum soli]
MTTPIRTTGQLGPVLRSLRKARGWSQAELGRRVGLSQERISAIESRPEKVNLDTLLTLAMALDAELSIGARAQAASTPESGEQW